MKQEATLAPRPPMARLVSGLVLLALGLAGGALPARAQDDALIDHAVRTCVHTVNNAALSAPWQAEYFRHFKATYNALTAQIEHNGWRRGDKPVVREFTKCMADEGFPVASSR